MKRFAGVVPSKFKKHFGWRMFFKIRYAPGEVILPKGVYCDSAGILIGGSLRIVRGDHVVSLDEQQTEDCWSRPGPWFQRLWNWVLDRTDRLSGSDAGVSDTNHLPPWWERFVAGWIRNREMFVTRHERHLADRRLALPIQYGSNQDESWREILRKATRRCPPQGGELEPTFDFVLGFNQAVWNQQRDETLAADPDDRHPCELLLVHRDALKEIDSQSDSVRHAMRLEFQRELLPHLLLRNKLFESLGLSHQRETFCRELARHYGRASSGQAAEPRRESSGCEATMELRANPGRVRGTLAWRPRSDA